LILEIYLFIKFIIIIAISIYYLFISKILLLLIKIIMRRIKLYF